MKTNVKLLIAIALMATACSTGSKVTSGGYSDDLYYTPGDARPTAPKPVKEVKPPQQKSMVAMQVEENEQGKVVNNYIVPKSSRKDRNAYYFDDQPAYSDTTLEYKDDKEQVTVNNYYEGEEMNYSARIRAFYNPYFYDPFWDPFWSPYWSPYYGSAFSFGWGGYYPWSWGWGGGWYDPWYYGYGYGFGYGFGWGGYYPGWGFGWGGGYYSGWGGGGWNSGNYYAGMQNHTGKRGSSNAVRYGINTNKSGSLFGSSAFSRSVTGRNTGATSTRLSAGSTVNGAVSGTRIGTGTEGSSTRLSSTRGNREGTTIQQSQLNSNIQSTRTGRGETIANLRRANINNIQGNGAINQNGSSTRSSSAGRDYTPTYNRPRMNTQPSYNNGSSRQYSSPQSTYSNSQTYRYARPQSTVRGFSGAVRSQSSGSYQRGSVSSATRSSGTISSGSSPSRSMQSSSPSRSFSAPSFSGGGSGHSGGSSNSGGGGSRSSGRTR